MISSVCEPRRPCPSLSRRLPARPIYSANPRSYARFIRTIVSRSRRSSAMARILVIEDDEPVRATIKRILESAGYEVSTATDGNDGLHQFREAPADLVLCDIFMPNKEGIATLRELRQVSGDVPVIMMSGGSPSSGRIGEAAFVDYLQIARLLGAAGTIPKPFRAAQLLAVVRKCLKGGPLSPPG